MLEDDDKVSHLAAQPTEVLLYIFSFLDAKSLIKCRRVCARWRCVIDSLQKNEHLWREYCKHDFREVYLSARSRARVGLSWHHLYKSLSLWPKLASARERRDEFASAPTVAQEIMDFKVLENGLIAVHKKGSVDYYDIETLEYAKRSPITGHYLRFNENNDTIVILGYQLHLYIVRKILYHERNETGVSFDNIKMYLLKDRMVYFVNLNNEIFFVDMDDPGLHNHFIERSQESIISLGFSTHLHMLTFERKVYSVIGNDLVYVCDLERATNIMHCLKQYNFLERLDWRVYFQWMYVLNHTIPDGPLRDIVAVRTYGDMVFVGSNWGVLRIYYSPYSAGEFDLYKAEPIKQYNFMEREDCPVLSDLCPIIQIDIVEGEDGHTVIVAMPKKLAVIEYVHNFKRTASVAMLPYKDVHRVKILKIDD